MDVLLVGALAALGTVVGMLYWVLLVRPHNLLGLFSAPPGQAPELTDAAEHASDTTYRALRVIGALLVLLVGFFTGLAVSFLAATS